MAKSTHKRKPRSGRFPLTLHPAGQHCKKIKGKIEIGKQNHIPMMNHPSRVTAYLGFPERLLAARNAVSQPFSSKLPLVDRVLPS
jgi:hypothetical protein